MFALRFLWCRWGVKRSNCNWRAAEPKIVTVVWDLVDFKGYLVFMGFWRLLLKVKQSFCTPCVSLGADIHVFQDSWQRHLASLKKHVSFWKPLSLNSKNSSLTCSWNWSRVRRVLSPHNKTAVWIKSDTFILTCSPIVFTVLCPVSSGVGLV